MAPDLVRGAEISACGRYRYRLWRRWGAGESVLWIMCNPSTADAIEDDPTIRRCIAFARAWGYGGVRVVNLFAWRSRNPREVRGSHSIDQQNEAVLEEELQRRGKRIAAWGSLVADIPAAARIVELLSVHRLDCLGTTKAGYPLHPLYVPASAQPIPYVPDAALCPGSR